MLTKRRKEGSFIRVRQKLGKYRIERRLAEGGFAIVYKAFDTISGIPVALKIPHPEFLNKELMDLFRKEVRVTAALDHPSILPIKDACYIDNVFVIVTPLGECSLADRLQKRMSVKTAVNFAEQILDAVAFAHHRHIMHCDLKPENFILFKEGRLRLADFGISKVARRTISASGSGTIGYVAPEQAMGKPSFRSDVFSLGLIICRLFSGRLPEWPFRWPPPGFERIRRHFHQDLIAFLKRAIEVNQEKRFSDAVRMKAAFLKLKRYALKSRIVRRHRQKGLQLE